MIGGARNLARRGSPETGQPKATAVTPSQEMQLSDVIRRIDFFTGAMPEAVFWGILALGVGAFGMGYSLLLAVLHLRDQASLRSGQRRPASYRPPRWGPLSQCLGEFFADPLHAAPLSPDAASEYTTGRIDAQHDVTQGIGRYSAYAPLLLGLMGTTLALKTLLVTGGSTLQEIQPQLSGVFAGTLAGIGGALIAAVGGLFLDRVALSTSNRAQDFIHRHILPTLPERRIAIRIEEAVLTAIGERAQAVVENFRLALLPLTREVEDVAVRCAKAADVAATTLAEAARAVREAGNIEAAAQTFKKGAHMIDSSAEQLADATKLTAEVMLRLGDVRDGLKAVMDRIESTAENLGRSSQSVGDGLQGQLVNLGTQVSRAEGSSGRLVVAVSALSTELIRRAQSDSAQVGAIAASSEVVAASITELSRLAKESAENLKALRAALDRGAFAPSEAGVVTLGRADVGGAAERADAALRSLGDTAARAASTIDQSVERLKQAFAETASTVRNEQRPPDATNGVRRTGFFGLFRR